MFTGIIETVGELKNIERDGGNIHFDVRSEISLELKVDQSVAHDGVCLTVVKVGGGIHRVTAIKETLEKSCLGQWKVGDAINLERCMPVDGRFDGHIVQGHVDTRAICSTISEDEGSWRISFTHPNKRDFLTVQKGSITINGVSLTVVDSEVDSFSVALIPYTFAHTNFSKLKPGDEVNLEFDILGKYVAKLLLRGGEGAKNS